MPVIGYAPGAYDMFHIGHLRILQRARSICDRLVAGVATDEMILRAKARHPVVPFEERLEIVASVRHVDEAVADPHLDKFLAWRKVGFHVLVKGDDWKDTERGEDLESRLGAVGVRIVYFPYTAHVSSTALRDRISVPECPGG
ncbi:glycerol-3-phosphate cytidylyltransferase [Actinopolyspora mzabensis]|uniref:Glycerol-3-phosphate cytidylyltransferase n=1 Tax=Actinopolyspora mzabensis TaxID=995066 RepID=A0A1G8YRF0_ACTMZ|nr:adenylyltransferase/cytidyltransferase family protein [Actinopolyspora mzabensis]SDK05317.1 glycerol-3-phosphate cytidylyltransferase [Actinopolyspora mzabensis]